jgi:hypothetical protein
MATTPIVAVKRSSSGLVDALFDCIDKLNAKEIDAEHARAVSHTARSIVQIAKLEMEYREAAATGGDRSKLTSLRIDQKAPEPQQ